MLEFVDHTPDAFLHLLSTSAPSASSAVNDFEYITCSFLISFVPTPNKKGRQKAYPQITQM